MIIDVLAKWLVWRDSLIGPSGLRAISRAIGLEYNIFVHVKK